MKNRFQSNTTKHDLIITAVAHSAIELHNSSAIKNQQLIAVTCEMFLNCKFCLWLSTSYNATYRGYHLHHLLRLSLVQTRSFVFWPKTSFLFWSTSSVDMGSAFEKVEVHNDLVNHLKLPSPAAGAYSAPAGPRSWYPCLI